MTETFLVKSYRQRSSTDGQKMIRSAGSEAQSNKNSVMIPAQFGLNGAPECLEDLRF